MHGAPVVLALAYDQECRTPGCFGEPGVEGFGEVVPGQAKRPVLDVLRPLLADPAEARQVASRGQTQALADHLNAPDSPHHQAPAALSLTNSTEYGTVYSAAEARTLIDLAKAKGVDVHLDGARLANAVASGFDPKAIAGLGVDVLVLGGTKAGMSPTEALVVFNKRLVRRLDARLKQAGQLPSKGRFYAAPWIGMLESGAFVSRAAHANQMAQRLAALMPFSIVHSVQANGIFVEMSDKQHRALTAQGIAVYRVADGSVRFMCSWATTPEAVDGLGEMLRAMA